MLDVLGQVVDLHAEGRLRLHHGAYVFARHADEVADREVRFDVLQEADDLERGEHRAVDDVFANHGHLKHADGRVLDGTELVVDERRHPLADVVLAETVLLERLGDAHC